MKKYIAGLLLVSASAHAGFLSGNTLLQHINNNEHLWQSYANGYIVGVHDMGDTILFCTPPTITVGQTKDIVRIYLEINPTLRHLSAESLVVNALKQAYPCAKRGTSS